MARMSKLPFGSLLVALIALAAVNSGTPDLKAWPYTDENVNDYSLPMQPADSVPFWAVLVFGIGMLVLFGLMEVFLCNSELHLLRRVRFVLLIGMTMVEIFFVTATLTSMSKYFVAEPRPDFKVRCLGSDEATPTYDASGNVICTGSISVIREGRNAFPSGHASTSMGFGMFGTLYLLWFVYMRNIHLPWRNNKGCMTVMWYQVAHALFCVCLFPMFAALGIACTRVRDHLHSPADVTAGAFLGALVAALYFLVRVVHQSPEHGCADPDQCECGQTYRRMKTTSVSSLSMASVV